MHEQIEDYLMSLEKMDKAEGTKEQYRKGLDSYSGWLEDEGLEPTEVDGRDLQRYLGWMKAEKEYAPKTMRVKFVAVRRFYADLSSNGGNYDNPAKDVVMADYAPKRTRKAEVTKERRVWLSKDEVGQLVQNVPAPELRNRLLILFQYYTGLRRQEVCDVKIEDLDREERQVQIRGKGGKIHTAHWQPKLDGLLTAWLDGGYRKSSPYAEESKHLFLTNTSSSLSGSQLNDIIKLAAEKAGIQKVLFEDAAGREHDKVTSHTLKHSFAMHFLKNGGTMEGLSKLLAHSSVKTTEIYGEILDERAKEEYEKYGPDIEIEL